MRTLAGRLGLLGGVLSLAFWVIVPITTVNTYLHAGESSTYAIFIVLSLLGIAGSLLVGFGSGWPSLLMALAVVPGIAALVLPGVLLLIAALLALAPQGTPRPGGVHRAGP